MFRTALALSLPAALTLFVLTGCEEVDDGGKAKGGTDTTAATTPGGTGGGTGGTSGGATGTADFGVNTDIPCGQILDCSALCDQGDQDCMNGCYEAGYDKGRDLYKDLDDCFVDNNCQDWGCVETNCATELQACEYDVPPGGFVCFADGMYEVCSDYGYCSTYTASGGGWGATEQYAGFWAEYDCSDHMTAMIIINNMNGTAHQVQSCQVTTCGAN